MISGTVTDLHPIVAVTFLLSNAVRFPIEFVLDTGFTGYLCLPPEAVELMRLPFLYELPAKLADDSKVTLPMYEATILWNGEEREVRVLATGRRPLLGTAMLENHELMIEFVEGGLVTINDL
jgi:clan AA aspartic protease